MQKCNSIGVCNGRGNALSILGVLTEFAILMLINYTPWGNSLLGTAPLGAAVWA